MSRAARAADTSPISWPAAAGIAAFCLAMVQVPWQEIWGGSFIDRTVYLNKFASYLARPGSKTLSGGVLAFLTNEVLWDLSFTWLAAQLNVPLEALFAAISFLCLYVFSKYLASRHGLAALFFLVNPLVVEFAFSQLRMALAVSLLMLAWFWRGRFLPAFALAAVACCIHTSAFLILFIVFCVKVVTARLAAGKSNGFYCWLALVAVGLGVALVIGPLREGILSFLGDRRATYTNYSQSLLYSSFWVLLLLVGATEKRPFFQSEGNAIATAFLATFAFAGCFNVYNSRFLAAAYPLIVSSVFALRGSKRVMLLLVYLLYVLAQWYYWVGAGWDSPL
jgi:hypothetical protein